jgi:hypothetical protein
MHVALLFQQILNVTLFHSGKHGRDVMDSLVRVVDSVNLGDVGQNVAFSANQTGSLTHWGASAIV